MTFEFLLQEENCGQFGGVLSISRSHPVAFAGGAVQYPCAARPGSSCPGTVTQGRFCLGAAEESKTGFFNFPSTLCNKMVSAETGKSVGESEKTALPNEPFNLQRK